MKKLLVLVAIFTTVLVTNAGAQQGGGDPAAMKARYVERVKPGLIEKAKLSEAEADKVIDITLSYRSQTRGLRDLAEDERKKKMEALQAAQDKDLKAIPLTDDQLKAVNAFFEEQRKQMQQQRQQNGGGNGGN